MSSKAELKTRRSEVPTLPAPRGCTNLKLRQLGRRVSQHYDRIVGAVGLKTSQYSLLSHIVTLGPIRPGEIGRASCRERV